MITILLSICIFFLFLAIAIIVSEGSIEIKPDEDKLWNFFIKNVDKFHYKEDIIGLDYSLVKYVWEENGQEKYTAIIWEDGRASIHKNITCILSRINDKSEIFAEKLAN